MTRIAVVGGHGKIALLLHPLLVERGHQPVALVRKEEYRTELEALGAEVRLLDIENAEGADYVAALEGCEAVVFTAGGGADGNVERKRTVDLGGSTGSIGAATALGIRRFVQVSAIGVDEPIGDEDDGVEESWRAYVEAKRDADAALRASDLEWTIIRPGRLTDDPGTGEVELADHVERGEVPRADVAAVLAEVLHTGAGVGRQWDLVTGDTPVADAVRDA